MNIFSLFSGKIMFDISCKSSAWQRIHKKRQALFPSKDKSKNNKSVVCCNLGLKKTVHAEQTLNIDGGMT